MGTLHILITVLVLVTGRGVYAGPTRQHSQCSLQCTEQNNLAYQTGISYVYDYSATTSTGLLGAVDKTADVHISAKAHIDVVSPCEYSLQLNSVSIEGSSKSEEFFEAVSAYPLRFAFQDGRIEAICSASQEPEWIVNFKRAVLSTFQTSVTQNTMGVNNVIETDVSGICNTNFNAYTSENVLYISKTKNMASCSQRPNIPIFTSLEDIDEYTEPPLQNLPIISSSQKCGMEVEEGILMKGGCSETHKFKPFSSDKGGAVTTTKTKLILSSQKSISSPVTGHEFIRSSLIFSKKEHLNTKVQIEIVENIMERIEMATQSTISSEVPTLFSSLVKNLRGLTYDQLHSVYSSAKKYNSLKYLIDAMPLVKTAAAMEIVKEMINNVDISDKEADVFFTSLAFIDHPSSEMFTVLAPLLDNKPMPKAMLGVSALMNNYCKMNDKCIEESGIQKVVRNIEFQLGSACRTTKEDDKNAVLVALKALGNAGHMVNSQSILRRCYTEGNDMEIRVAAIEAWRHTSCDYDRSNLLTTFQDETQDTEIRIAAYLATMTCPTSEIVDVIYSHLTSEGVNQVTSFVWTHITNIQESAAPGKQFIQKLISEELLQNKFKNDALKFSRNLETSVFRGDLNVGAAIESNVVFSSKSILPRSAMLNLTVDLFGESINFFEVGGRINGFESIIEKFFGPNGYYPEETVQNIISMLRKQQNNGEDTFEGISEKMSDEPEGSYYLRIFGNEVSYNRFHGFSDLMKGGLLTNPFELLMELANNGDIDYTKSYQFLDNELIFPTATGLPLKLKLDGTATLALKASGNFNLHSMNNVNIEGKIYPSAAVMIDSSMSVDSPLIHSGMKMVSTLHTSTYIEGKLRVDGAKIVDVAINTPKEKMEIISVNTELFHIEDDNLIKEEQINTIKDNTCTQGTLGIAICKETTYITQDHLSPDSYISNLVTAKVYMKKIDTQTGYLLQYIHNPDQLYFIFDTPASKINRNIAFSLKFKENQVIYDLVTPIKSIKGKGEIEWQAMNKKLMINNIIDGKQYTLQGGISTTENNELKTEFKITYQEEIIFDTSLTGHIVMDKGFSSELEVNYNFMNNIQNSFKHSSSFKTESNSDVSKYNLHFDLKSSQYSSVNLEINWQTELTPAHFDNQLKVQYGPAVWNVRLMYEGNNNDDELKRNALFELSCPYYNFDNKGTLRYLLQPDHFQFEVLFKTGEHKYHQRVNLSYESGVKLSGSIQMDIVVSYLINISNTASIEIKKLQKGHYTIQMAQRTNIPFFNRETTMEGSFIDQSSPGTVKIDVLGSFKDVSMTKNEIKLKSSISADDDVAKADFNLEHNGSEYYASVEATRSSLALDSNIVQHIVLSANINPFGKTRKFNLSAEWNKDVDPTATMSINGEFSRNLIKAGIKYSMSEIFILVNKLDTGLELETSWSPNEKVAAKVIYSLDNVKSFTIILNTPFKGYESQILDVMFSIVKNEVRASFSATWSKIKLLLFTLNTKVLHGLHSNILQSNINFSSPFKKFALLNLSLNHEMNNSSVLTEVNSQWNDQKLNGRIDFKTLKTGAELIAAFVSPFTEDFIIDIKCSVDPQNLSLVSKGQYGLLHSNISVQGYKTDNNNLSITLAVDTPYQSIPKIISNISYRFDGIKNELLADSKIGDKKYKISINTSKEIRESSLNITGNIRLITPLSDPITINFYNKQDNEIFTSNFDTTRFWTTNGSLKGNIEGKVISGNDMHFLIGMTSPDFNFASEINHRFHNKQLNSNIDLTINEEHITVDVKGKINASNHKSDIMVTLKTPFYKIIEVNTKYNLVKLDELFSFEIVFDQNKYGFSFGGSIVKDSGFINLEMKTPIKEWNDVKLNIKIDFSNVNKTFAIMLEKDGNVKAISISGEVFGDMDLKIQFPDIGMQNLDLSLGGSDRTKRSIESKMMNDGYFQFDKFNSMKVNLKSDYAAYSDFYLEWTQDNEFTNKISVKKNDNYFNMEMKEGNRKSWDISVESQYEGFAIRRLFGYIDASEFETYLLGQAKDDPSTLKASGSFGPKRGTYTMEINSPYEAYKKVESKLDYNLATKSLSFNAKSSSSTFKIDVQLKGRIKIDLIVPNSSQDVILNMDVNPFRGNIHWESPFEIKSYDFKHEVRIGKTSSIKVNTKLNEQDQFSLIFESNKSQKTSNLNMEIKGQRNYVIRFNRVAWEEISVSLNVDDSELKLTANGSGSLPQQGKFDVVFNINLENFVRTYSMQAFVDRSAEEKSLKLETEFEAGKLYTADLKYILNYKNMKVGQYKLDVTAPEKIKSSFSNTAAKWDLTKGDASEVQITVKSITYTIKGEFGRTESNLVISSDKPGTSDMLLQWKSNSIHPTYDSLFKIGPKKKYFMWKVKGEISTGRNGNIEVGFRIPMVMKHDFIMHTEFKTDSSGVTTGGGKLQYGDKSGEHVLKSMTHDNEKRSGSVHWEATSTIPNANNIVWKGEYDYNKKFHVNHKIEWDTNSISINFDVGENNVEFSNNKGILHAPMLGDVELIFNHDFRNKMAKSVTWMAKVKGKEYSIISTWGSSDDFQVWKGEVKLIGPLIGKVEVNWDCDTSNIKDSKLEIAYKRNDNKNISLVWSRKVDQNVMRSDYVFESHFKSLKYFKFFIKSDYTEGINLESFIEWTNKITFNLLLDHSKLNMKFTTPFKGYEGAEGLINYDLGSKTKTIKAHYERGDRIIDFDMKAEMPNNNEGSLSITASSPFPFAKNVDINATWKNGKCEVNYKRNDVTLSFNGDAVVTSDKVSFDLAFIPNNQDPIKLGATYNLANIIDGNTDTPKTLARIDFEIDGYKSKNEMKGYRNSDRLYMLMDATSNIPGLKHFKLLIDTHLNKLRSKTQFLFNEFDIITDSLYENRPNGFYIRSQTYSSYLPLSGLITGIGVENGETILTLGYGEITEIVMQIKPKETWAKGFTGKMDFPMQNFMNVRFDTSYKYNSDDELLLTIEIEEHGRKSNFEIIYNSDGLKGAVSSPFFRKRSIRMQRSITNDSLFAEAVIDDYEIKLRKGFSNETIKKGIKIEGEIFGEKILIDTLFRTEEYEYAEGRVIIEIPFVPKLGGHFTWTNKDKNILAQTEIYLPSSLTPRISCEINLDLNEVNGFITVNILDQEYIIKGILSDFSVDHTKFELLINKNAFIFEHSIDNAIIKARVETIFHGNRKNFSIESDFSSINTIKININSFMNGKNHKFDTLFNVDKNHVQGYLELNSEFINGSRKVNFDIAIPAALFESFSIDIYLVSSETYSLHLDYEANNGLKLNILLENSDVSQLALQVLCNHSTVYISLELPNCIHKVNATWYTLQGLPLDFTGQIEFSSTLFSRDYLLTGILNNEISNKSIDFQLIAGSDKHSMAGNIITTETSAEASLRVDSTYIYFKEALVNYIVIPENSMEIIMSGTFGDKMNQFIMKIDQQKGRFVAVADSPFISTGLARVEASLMGDIDNGIEFNIALKNSNDVISFNLNLHLPNHVLLKVNTPFTGYKNMIFGAKYNTGDTNVISLFVEKPLKVNLDIEFSNKNNLYQTHIKLCKSKENLEIIEAEIFIPMNIFAPRIMWNIHGQKYGIDMKVEQTEYNRKLFGTVMTGDHIYSAESIIKIKAPFVWAYKIEKKPSDAMLNEDTFSKYFHIRMDSSFLEMFKTQFPLLSMIRNN